MGKKQTAEELLASLEKVGRDTLRCARVRLDALAMKIERHNHTIMFSNIIQPNFHIYTDASPQWRGAELLATVIETFLGQYYSRRLAPVVSLGRDLLGVHGKTIALLWQVYLIAGPSFEGMRKFLRRVRSLTTDMGAERGIADHSDILVDFFTYLDPDFRAEGRERLEYLFPRAIQTSGWQHMWDLLVRNALSSVTWFPKWLDLLKAVVTTLRLSLEMEAIVKFLKPKHLGFATILESLSVPSFAHWR